MKTKEELNALKEELEALNEKCRELTEEELKEVTGGITPGLMGPIAVETYSIMSLVPVIQPPI